MGSDKREGKYTLPWDLVRGSICRGATADLTLCIHDYHAYRHTQKEKNKRLILEGFLFVHYQWCHDCTDSKEVVNQIYNDMKGSYFSCHSQTKIPLW